ncbi:hypothetical protein MJO29_015595 [Puccinia striiformis f. sp. tritici]|uniref:Cullin family profile domain-containing protein n=1 Tax=Puccinia striiformis f. sp. tritici PST-78 TaxID=1165861 RepID=A0A0L0V521_9BASI|nr:hypothetical protein Pst134EA_029230 [Puccinia striiformis f. sp. tritici]KAI9630878.1 hypothetical protein KEM48_013495 [Puccinia striiformis f. sp. tritici PST-130]KNE94296.1 hypothetical protein PSTG_12321 [Puccinia striiformis f. sp. tritici PST-78]KAH9441221.1 hypothetical protein Pst134EB_029889 [Puccinia striiformis f. sp. tritici]KAH9447193.1 hypothetical protein Pst134EA_029230 [Puccinia striiformis f. sp. tritici]KAI7936292.1 hypothetical protein MJO29_015595 [Puccinia striiformis
MRSLTIHAFLGASFLILGCWGGLIPERRAAEVFKDVYADLGLTDMQSVSKSRKKPKESHINTITQSLNDLGQHGRDRLLDKIVNDWDSIFGRGRIEFEGSWKKYMVDSRFTKTGTDFPETPEEEQLRGTLHNLCNEANNAWAKLRRVDLEALMLHARNELGYLKVTNDTVRVAVDFYTFILAWRSSLMNDSFAYALAISRSGYKWPDHRDDPLIKKISSWSRAKQSITFQDYQKAVHNMIPRRCNEIPIQSRMGHYDKESCHINIIRNFLEYSSNIDFSFLGEESYSLFWKHLLSSAAEGGFQPLMNGYKEFCSYYRNGIPFDNSFEYYQRISQFSKKIQNHLASETDIIPTSQVGRLEKIPASYGLAQDLQPFKRTRASTVDGERSLFSISRLVINYVEEFSQQTRQKGIISKFSPEERAKDSQLEQIAILICDHWSPIYNSGEDVTTYDVNLEVEKQKFPFFVEHTMLRIMGNSEPSYSRLRNLILQKVFDDQGSLQDRSDSEIHEIRRVISEMNSKSATMDAEEIKKKYNDELNVKLSKFQMTAILNPGQVLIQNHETSWEQINRLTIQEFSSISSKDARRLVLLLEHGHRLRRNLPILNNIYYCMAKTNPSEKELILELVGRRLKLLKGYISERESDVFSQMYALIQENSDQVCYKNWTNTLLKPLSSLPHYSAKAFDDIWWESSRRTYLSRLSMHKPRFDTILLFGDVQKKFLTPEINQKLAKTTEDLMLSSIEDEIEIMAHMLKRGQVDEFLEKEVGYLINEEAEKEDQQALKKCDCCGLFILPAGHETKLEAQSLQSIIKLKT